MVLRYLQQHVAFRALFPDALPDANSENARTISGTLFFFSSDESARVLVSNLFPKKRSLPKTPFDQSFFNRRAYSGSQNLLSS